MSRHFDRSKKRDQRDHHKQHSERKRENRGKRFQELPDTLCVGKNPVLELLRRNPERIEKLFFSHQILRQGEFIDLIESLDCPCKEVDMEVLDELSPDARHQGIIAIVQPRVPLSLPELLSSIEGEEQVSLVLLDEITDPHNVGAILRACECFGVRGVIYSRNRIAAFSSVVSKSSAGALDLISLCEVGNLAQSVEKLKEHGFWIVSANVSERCAPVDSFEFPQKTVLILGSEGSGIQRLLLEKSDYEVAIPMKGHIDSLNVSQAAAVILSKMGR